jgi:uncharacterized protein (DUF1501 family)
MPPLTRREVLQLAAGMGLAWLLPALDGRAAERRGKERPKSLIVLWLAGGPSQLETWDPHPGTKIGGPTQAISTSLAGVRIAADFPRVAEQLHHFAVLRSLVSKEGDHERGTYLMKTGYRPDTTLVHPALGAILTHELPDPRVEIPLFVSLGNEPHPSRGGYLGDEYDPYRVFEPGRKGQNLEPRVGAARQQRRLKGLELATAAFQQGRTKRVENTLHQHTVDAALKMMTSSQLQAFSLDEETAATKAAYGDSDFGRGCLIARRLVETGVRTVEVTLNGFDTHADNFTGHTLRAGLLDPALAALVRDLRERDLWQSTVVLVTGEFGRTPHINPAQGRDHWPSGFACLLGGGGLRGGVVLGATDPQGVASQPEDPIPAANVHATILKTLGVDYAKELITPIGRPLKLCEGEPLEVLLPTA